MNRSNKALISIFLAIAGIHGAEAGVYLEDYSDIYTTRSEEIGRYNRIFEAGKEAGKTILIINDVIQPPIIKDLSNPVVSVLESKDKNTEEIQEVMKSDVVASKETRVVAHQTVDRLKESIYGRYPVKTDILNSDSLKNEWITVGHIGNQAGTLGEIAASIMPVGWQVDVHYKDRGDQEQKYEFAVTDTREGALTELLTDSGYKHVYFIENKQEDMSAPVLIIHAEGSL